MSNPTEIRTKRVTVLVGPSGSGKSEIAVNLAYIFLHAGEKPVLIDLDTVKPYFRSRFVRDNLEADDIEILVPEDDRLYADIPVLPPGIRSRLAKPDNIREKKAGLTLSNELNQKKIIVDVGGNDNGARVLGSISDIINPEETDVLFILNFNRPLSSDIDSTIKIIEEISHAAGIKVTGLVSNTHLIQDTSSDIVRSGLNKAVILSEKISIPIVFYCVPTFSSTPSTPFDTEFEDYPVMHLKRYIVPPHLRPSGSGPARVL